MTKTLSEMEMEFIDRMGKISKRWGIGEPAGRVWGALLFANYPLSQKAIAEKTDYSLSLVSPSLTILENNNMIRSVRVKSKEKLYETNTLFIGGFRALIKGFLEQDIKPLIADLENTKGVDKNPKLLKLMSEYKRIKWYFDTFEKLKCVKNLR
ncbi:MAG: GbsR/MarR family transcriptional regulator [Candidatus Woesearchaeota archaeon]